MRYYIETLTEYGWDSAPIGENNEFSSRAEAEAAIQALRGIGTSDWRDAQYRVNSYEPAN